MVLYGGELIPPSTNLINGHASQVTAAPMKWSQECFGRKSTSSITNISFSLSEVTDKTSYIFSYDVNRARSYEGYDDLWMTVETTGRSDTLSIIKLGSERKSTKYLMSPDSDFTLGFFGANNSYLGIWYTYDNQSREIWVANPNTPITSTSSAHALSIEPNSGNLIITVEGRTVMNVSNVKDGPYTSVSARLQDT
ncbi:G-type lectin S-receptor-like serine/threonine-protein kinase, partial [Tanacetum coccineum]